MGISVVGTRLGVSVGSEVGGMEGTDVGLVVGMIGMQQNVATGPEQLFTG